MKSTVPKLLKEGFDIIICEGKKEENVEKIKQLMDPLIEYMFQKLYPYIVITSIMFVLTFTVALCILYMLIRSTNNNS